MSEDTIFIEGLRVDAILGIFEHERETPQPVVFDVQFGCDTRAAAASEDIADTVSYAEVADHICDLAQRGRYQLVETLAAAVADDLLHRFGVARCRVKVSKPVAVAAADAVGVIIERSRIPS